MVVVSLLLLKLCLCSSRSSRSSSRLLRSTSHLCFAQQSLTMCQQRYLPHARAEDGGGKLVSAGKLMWDVIKTKHPDKSENLSFCSCVENVRPSSTRTSTSTAKLPGEVLKGFHFLSVVYFKKVNKFNCFFTDFNEETRAPNPWCLQSCSSKASQLWQKVKTLFF